MNNNFKHSEDQAKEMEVKLMAFKNACERAELDHLLPKRHEDNNETNYFECANGCRELYLKQLNLLVNNAFNNPLFNEPGSEGFKEVLGMVYTLLLYTNDTKALVNVLRENFPEYYYK
jgi:hypothetical protein